MRLLHIRPKQFEFLGFATYAARLHRFVIRYVKTPEPVTLEALTKLLEVSRPSAGRCDFDSEADLALYAIANLCLPDKMATGELKALLANQEMPLNEKRYQLSAELDRRQCMAFGALEVDHEEP